MPASDPEEALFAELRSRDARAFERLYDDFGRRAFGLAYQLTGDYGVAQDVVQEAFLSIWQNAERLDPQRGRFVPLLFAVVHHKASDQLRRQRRRPQTAPLPDAAQVADTGDDPVQQTLQQADRHAIGKALLVLPPEQRLAVQLAYYGGHSHSEIARLTQAPLGTVKSRLRIALRRLRLILWPGIEA